MGWGKEVAPASGPGERVNAMLLELAQRRSRLRDFVLRDTVGNTAYFEALQKL
jgi:hypothetical protein